MSPFNVFLAGSDVGEDGREEIVGAHALTIAGEFLPPRKRRRPGLAGVQRQRVAKIGGIQSGLFQNWLGRFRVEILEDVGQGEAVLLG